VQERHTVAPPTPNRPARRDFSACGYAPQLGGQRVQRRHRARELPRRAHTAHPRPTRTPRAEAAARTRCIGSPICLPRPTNQRVSRRAAWPPRRSTARRGPATPPAPVADRGAAIREDVPPAGIAALLFEGWCAAGWFTRRWTHETWMPSRSSATASIANRESNVGVGVVASRPVGFLGGRSGQYVAGRWRISPRSELNVDEPEHTDERMFRPLFP
jgi:hypothetical protein